MNPTLRIGADERRPRLLIASEVPEVVARARTIARGQGFEPVPTSHHDLASEALEDSLLLLDLRLGGAIDAGTLASLRCDIRLADLPVIALVGEKEDAGIRDALSAGADDYVRDTLLERELPFKLLFLRRAARIREDLQRREKELRTVEQAARGGLIAELAGAAAHELNQPLTAVMGYAELLEKRVDPADPILLPLRRLREEAERMASIVRRIAGITRYETMDYVAGARIVDLERSSPSQGGSR